MFKVSSSISITYFKDTKFIDDIFSHLALTRPKWYSAEQTANIIMEDESGDSDEVESDFSEEDIVGSEDQFSDGSSSE